MLHFTIKKSKEIAVRLEQMFYMSSFCVRCRKECCYELWLLYVLFFYMWRFFVTHRKQRNGINCRVGNQTTFGKIDDVFAYMILHVVCFADQNMIFVWVGNHSFVILYVELNFCCCVVRGRTPTNSLGSYILIATQRCSVCSLNKVLMSKFG